MRSYCNQNLAGVEISSHFISSDRRKGDQGRAVSFINAFSTSNVPNFLIKWATFQAGSGALSKPIANTPQSIISMCKY
jgi:hypothetical protein